MATTVDIVYAHADWLFSCNDPVLLAKCPRYIHSVFNLIMDILMGMIHVMVNCTAQKGYLLYQCHMTVLQLIELSADQLLVLIDRRLRSRIK